MPCCDKTVQTVKSKNEIISLKYESHKFQKIVENEKVTIMGNFICAKVPRLASSESYIQSRITKPVFIHIHIVPDSSNLENKLLKNAC